MPINFIRNQIQTGAAAVREKLPFPIKVLAGAAGLMLLVVISLAVYRLNSGTLPFFAQRGGSFDTGTDTEILRRADSDVVLYVLPDELQAALQQNPDCPLELAMCPDGSQIGRIGPNCSFPACPGELAPPSPNQVYENFTYGNSSAIDTLPTNVTEEEYLEYMAQQYLEK